MDSKIIQKHSYMQFIVCLEHTVLYLEGVATCKIPNFCPLNSFLDSELQFGITFKDNQMKTNI